MPKTTWSVNYSPTGELKDITSKEFDNESDARKFLAEAKAKGYKHVGLVRTKSYDPGKHWYFG